MSNHLSKPTMTQSQRIATEPGLTTQQRAIERWEGEGGEIPVVKIKRNPKKPRVDGQA